MKRRDFVVSVFAAGVAGPAAAAAQEVHSHQPISGPLANATVSFGAWQTDPPFDRFVDPTDRTRNVHQLTPHEATVRAGGTVNFVIAGFHLVLVYGPDTQPADINTTLVVPGSMPALINDPANRVYRGLDPRTQPQDRVEVVHFPNPGTYLVICGVRPHFVNDGMFGYVTVLP